MSFAKWQRHSTFLSIAWADVDWRYAVGVVAVRMAWGGGVPHGSE